MAEQNEERDDSIVVPHQDEVRVFENQSGQITIMQTDQGGAEHIVVIAPQHAQTVADALVRLATEISERQE